MYQMICLIRQNSIYYIKRCKIGNRKILTDIGKPTMILFGHLGLTYAAVRAIDKAALKGKSSMDYRLVFIGSMLPDLIDKPIIFFISNDSIHSGRIFAHTLLFGIFLTILGLIIRKKSTKPWAFVVAGSCMIHLVLDSMWHYLNVLFWPAFGLSGILKQDFKNVSLNSIRDVLMEPYLGIPEICGLLIVIIFMVRLAFDKQIGNFIKTGKIG